MLKKIKSEYILKYIFDLLEIKFKLNLIKCNKSLQKRLMNELDYFKKISGRYLIQDNTFNYGKEFTIEKNTLVYIGGYNNNKRNGKGFEYDENGVLKFKGEFVNGKRNGSGKEYKKYELNGINYIYFEGNYKNGKKNGIGKIYKSNKIKFEGEFLNDLKEGLGKEYYYNGKIKFKGEYKNNKKWNGEGYDINDKFDYIIKEGKGNIKLYRFYDSNLKFEGEYKNGEKNGKGKEKKKKKNGLGKEYFYVDNKILYSGEYKDGKIWNGKGYDINGNIVYEIKDGKGYVKLYTDYGSYCHFLGEYKNGEANGLGKSFWQGKSTPLYKEFEGEYKDGEEYEGKRYKYNQLVYEGSLKKDKYWTGKEYYFRSIYPEINFYEGEYLNGAKWKGIEKVYENKRNKLIIELEYINGKIKNVKGYNPENNKIDYEIKNGNGFLKYYRYKFYKNKDTYYLYFDMQLINGEIKGIGKEYNENGKLIFEGEYYNGVKNGKGKEYDESGKLIFEGEYYNGVKNGKGKDYFLNGKIMFEGIYINDEKFIGTFYGNRGKKKKEIKNGEGNEDIYHNNGKIIFK